MLTLHGIKACDTMKKARAWLAAHRMDYRFHDYRADGAPDEAALKRWCAAAGWTAVLNRAGTTFRALPDSDKNDLTESRAIGLMRANPTLIKRPVLEGAGLLVVGFRPEIYAKALRL